MQAAYPVALDLTNFFSEAGFNTGGFSLAGINVTQAVAGGIARFESDTGRRFLSTNAGEARTFDPPGNYRGMLDLKADLILPTAVSLSGSALVSGTDYRFLPQQAVQNVEPYDRIQLVRVCWPSVPPLTNYWGALSITGTWAYGSQIPDDAWQAMLAAAALNRLPQIVNAALGGMIELKESDISETYGPKPFQVLREAWTEEYQAAVSRYRRVTVGW
jgi:hypothetical protein